MHRPNLAAKFCPHRNNTVTLLGFECPNPIPHPLYTEADSDPDPDFASQSTFSDEHYLLEAVRKSSRFPNLPFPSGFGEPPAEGAEDAVAFSTWPWWVLRVKALIHAIMGGGFW